ncbi:hypothetical protein ABZZ74_25995 [Streptomyces sp. NPDC006476]|uniref:hypothetical protein n=1 Tax=Streptomyces sp. NPDC006476 TaxID=3157175 RepID=UPI0033A374AF
MELKVSSLAGRPDMLRAVLDMPDSWPEFTIQDPVGNAHYGRIATELPEYVLFAGTERGEVLAHAFSGPFRLATEGRHRLPDRGWDQVLVWAFADLRRGVRPDTVSAISIVVAPHAQGLGLHARAGATGTGVRRVCRAECVDAASPLTGIAHSLTGLARFLTGLAHSLTESPGT